MSALKKSWWTAVSAAIGVFTLVATANAQNVSPNITVTPVTKSFPYNLAPGASTLPIPLPANIPVHLVGVQTAVGFRGVGEVALLKVPNNFIEWVGLESTAGAAITQGFSGSAGTHIVFLDFDHTVDVEVANPNQIKIVNKSGSTATGSITLFYGL